MTRFDVLIVGTGHGGAQAAIALRRSGYGGRIGLLGRESEPPYERPPLSKDYLAGERPFERILIRPAGFWAERGIELLPGREAVALDPGARTLGCADGERIGYGSLIWAAGGTPRRLGCPGEDLGGVHALRLRADADSIAAGLAGAERVAVVGGGYIGLEAAAVMAKLGRKVILLEAMDRVLNRVAGEPLSRFYEAEHRARGVDVRLGARVAAIEGKDGRAAGLRLESGETLPADLVVVGIGIAAAAGPLLDAGAAGGDGVHVDGYCRTTLAGIYAVGDCAAYENRWAGGRRIRLESVQNAADQANVAARHVAGQAPQPYSAMPWFWSNQYDLRLQTVGLSKGHDLALVRGDPADRSFSIVYFRAGRVIALDCVNATRDYVQGRRLVETGLAVDPALVADAERPLKSLE